uniref:Fe2OG dioxygenase domain-containing protein n=1 Tax=Chenopodium quinoa TaxID=63459 RepID=A0A803MV92_CHEQI
MLDKSKRNMEKEAPKRVNLGKSIIVPSVQELAKESITNIPSRYEIENGDQPDRPINPSLPLSIPVIDLQRLLHGDFKNHEELDKLHLACKEWGFFQVVNHEVSASFLETFKIEVTNFLKLPMEEKKKLWQEEDNQEGFGQLFVVSEDQKLEWCDMFFLITLPPELRKPGLYNKLPQNLRVTLESYIAAIKDLAQTLLNQMAKALGIDEGEMTELFNEMHQTMRMNYYPPCPEPNKAIGLRPHSDATTLAILHQLNDTVGLEIKKDGNWVPVMPLENAFVVNIGDALECTKPSKETLEALAYWHHGTFHDVKDNVLSDVRRILHFRAESFVGFLGWFGVVGGGVSSSASLE